MRTICADKLSKIIGERTNGLINEGKLGCAEIIVEQDGRRVFHECFGADPVTKCELKPGALFRAASMTKPVTTAAFLKAVYEGKVDLNAPVSEYLPEYSCMNIGYVNEKREIVIGGKAKRPLLVYQLFCHVNGIGVSPMCEITAPDWKSTADTCAFYAKQPLAFEPGSATAYSPTAAFDVAARILELVTGMPFAEYVKKNITAPLGMADTVYEPSPAQWQRLIGMHARNGEGLSVPGKTYSGCVFSNITPAACAAGAGMTTTAEDYSKFARMLLNLGMGDNGVRILPEDAVRRMSTPQVSEEVMPADERWGLGVRVITRKTYAHRLPVGSFGWSGAYGTHFWVDPVNRITAVYMKNSLFDGGAGCHTAKCFEEDVMASLEEAAD